MPPAVSAAADRLAGSLIFVAFAQGKASPQNNISSAKSLVANPRRAESNLSELMKEEVAEADRGVVVRPRCTKGVAKNL